MPCAPALAQQDGGDEEGDSDEGLPVADELAPGDLEPAGVGVDAVEHVVRSSNENGDRRDQHRPPAAVLRGDRERDEQHAVDPVV